MIKLQKFYYMKSWKVILDLSIKRCISYSAIKHQDSLTKDVSKRLFPEKLRQDSYSHEVNVQRIATILDGQNVKLKSQLRQFLSSESMKPRYDISTEQEKSLSHQRLKEICEAGFVSVEKVRNDPQSLFLAHEMAAVVDPAMAFKMNAQFNWFADTLFKLGSVENYGKIIKDIDNLNAIGCFGLTELGYGNGNREIETTALYHHDTRQIVLDTPNPLAQKYWVTNAAVQANFMIVFAQLYVKGVNVGVHGLLVQIRDSEFNLMPGVHIEDLGHKMGMNGIDAAKVSFDNVRISPHNLLNQHCNITPSGDYISPFKSDQQKFYVMCDELLKGKISLAAMCIGSAKASLAIAIKYAASRLVPGPNEKNDVTILQYQLHQRALIPLLARTCGLQLGLNYVQNRYCYQPQDGSHHADIVTLVCAIKALLSWNLEKVVTVCREKCGGQGILSCNRFGSFLGLAHAAIGAEGDNSVLMQKAVRQRLVVFRNRSLTSPPRDFFSLQFLHDLINKKENLLFKELSARVTHRGRNKAFELWVLEEAELVQACGMAFIERVVSDELVQLSVKWDDKQRIFLSAIHRLYILDILERDLGQVLSNGVIGPMEVGDLKYESKKLCKHLSECAVELVDAFGFSAEMLSAPVAHDWVQYNAGDNKGEV